MEYLDNSAVQSPYAGSRPEVRSGLSSVQVCWPRLADPTVSRLHLRFRHGSRPFSGWSPLEAYKTCAVVGKADSTFPVENVTAQVRAVNERLMTSDVITSVVRVDDSKPVLTGTMLELLLFLLSRQSQLKCLCTIVFVFVGRGTGGNGPSRFTIQYGSCSTDA